MTNLEEGNAITETLAASVVTCVLQNTAILPQLFPKAGGRMDYGFLRVLTDGKVIYQGTI